MANRKQFGFLKFPERTDQLRLRVVGIWPNRALLTVVLLAPTCLVIGCAGVVSAGGTKSQTTQQAAIQVTPGSLNFGSLAVGRKASQTATVTNTGTTGLNVTAASVSNGQFSVSGINMPLSLQAGQSSTFQVWFAPSAAGNVAGTLTIQGDNGVSPGQVALSGIAMSAPQQISVSSTSLNLGSATVGTTTNGSVTLTNSGGANLMISLISVSAGPFGVSGITTPSTIVPGASATMNVSFSPTTAGSDSGSITITSNDPQTPTIAISLTGTATSSPVAPTITTQPVNQTVTAGQTATFTVVAGGTAPLSYQWQKNGVNIAGATGTSYTTPATATTDSGSTFRVVVTNTAGNVTSNAANLTVTAAAVAPTITTQPMNQTVTAGQTATFTVVAGGTTPLSYQWQKNGANIAGATGASYTTPATATTDSGLTFDVIVSNTAGTVTSSAATLTVNAAVVAPTITTQPVNQSVTAGQTATFTVVAGGTAPLSYQWQKNGVNIAGATGTSYTTPVTATTDSGSTFRVVVTNTAGNVTSNAANLTVTAAAVAPTITTQPVNQTVTAGQTATFTVVAGGTAPLSYQWQKNGVNIAGATGASYTTPVTATTDSGSTFRVVVTNTAGNVTSNAANLTVTAAAVAPTITTQPVNQTVTAGQTATFTVVAGGTAPLSYQWQKNGVNIAGATGSNYTTPATATTDSGSTFDVIVSNTAGTVTSSAATLTVNASVVAPTITTQPVNQTVTAGQTATFTVVAGGTAPLSYQWQKNGVNIAGATGTSYTTPVTATTDSGSTFRVVVTNTAGTVTSSAATLTVNPAPAPAIQVSPTPINFGNDVVGSNSTQALVITNTGTATLTITQVNETGSAFNVSGFSLPLNVNAGSQTMITVAFVPTSVGASSGNLSIVSNAPTSPTSVSLTGTGIAATLTLGVSPTNLNFGNVTTGTTSASQNVTVTNTGNSSVTISQINLTGSGYLMTGGAAPVTLSPTQNLILSVQFNPSAAGSVNGSISIVSNATGSPATVSLSGTGVAPVQHSVALNWDASTSTVSGYNVYRSSVSGSGYMKINSSLVISLTYTDATVQSGTTYYYVTTAVDSSGNESMYSNQATATIP
ncbi:MAG TPA: choice-of-anchor D domain-containing protein [Candidatus Solibacter sp.]|nr:choice-of-anchor D domain-containing protein [Candidatus Solibacter sp.]